MEWITTKEAQAIANCHYNTVMNWIRRGTRFEFRKIEDGLTYEYRINKSSFLNFLSSRKIRKNPINFEKGGAIINDIVIEKNAEEEKVIVNNFIEKPPLEKEMDCRSISIFDMPTASGSFAEKLVSIGISDNSYKGFDYINGHSVFLIRERLRVGEHKLMNALFEKNPKEVIRLIYNKGGSTGKNYSTILAEFERKLERKLER